MSIISKKNGSTALLWASYEGHKEIVEMLMKTNVDVNVKNSKHKGCLKRQPFSFSLFLSMNLNNHHHQRIRKKVSQRKVDCPARVLQLANRYIQRIETP